MITLFAYQPMNNEHTHVSCLERKNTFSCAGNAAQILRKTQNCVCRNLYRSLVSFCRPIVLCKESRDIFLREMDRQQSHFLNSSGKIGIPHLDPKGPLASLFILQLAIAYA